MTNARRQILIAQTFIVLLPLILLIYASGKYVLVLTTHEPDSCEDYF